MGVVVMPEFRNSMDPAQPGFETAKFPGGLNDCISTVHWVSEHQEELGINGKIILAGESGGGNLTISTALSLKKAGKIELIKGFYALCPYISGVFPHEKFPSTRENAGILLDYPIDGEPLVVNEYDPLRDEGIDFYNRCNALGIESSLTILPGTVHGTGSYFVGLCPDMSKAQAESIFKFCTSC